MTLVVDSVHKRFGAVEALAGVSFVARPGQVFGFLGANGAGKTTTMRIVLGLQRPDAGSVTWGGEPVARAPRRTWGYLPEERGLYPRMRVLEQLVFLGSLHGLERADAARRARDWLARFRIPHYADRRAEELSKGNEQKIQFIAAVLHEPDVLLMDEPFTGLDPVNVALLKAAFLELRDRGKTLVFSTHQMEMVEELCDAIAIIDRGRIVLAGPTAAVRRGTGRVAVRVATAGSDLGWLASIPGATVTRAGLDYHEVQLPDRADPEAILREALRRGAPVRRFEVAQPSIEDIFIERVGPIATDERTLAAATQEGSR